MSKRPRHIRTMLEGYEKKWMDLETEQRSEAILNAPHHRYGVFSKYCVFALNVSELCQMECPDTGPAYKHWFMEMAKEMLHTD